MAKKQKFDFSEFDEDLKKKVETQPIHQSQDADQVSRHISSKSSSNLLWTLFRKILKVVLPHRGK
jgi:hypothetical protein